MRSVIDPIGYCWRLTARGLSYTRERWSRRISDRGSATSLMAMVLGGGVLMGASAVVVDVGQLYQEREELQSGADSAAMALAKVCAKADNTLQCRNALAQRARAENYANLNAKDGHSRVTRVCGSPGTGLPTCPSTSGATKLTECIDTGGIPAGLPYVEVRVETETANGETLLPPSFARGLVGGESYDGTTVVACARAAWGAPARVTGAAITASYCTWETITSVPGVPHSAGTRVGPQPPAVPSNTNVEGVIRMHGSDGESLCDPARTPSGWNTPGGFGWLAENGGPCRSIVSTADEVAGATGVSGSGDCKDSLLDKWTNHPVVMWIPVFDGVSGSGNNATYRIRGVSAFVLTGYRIPGAHKASWLTGDNHCNGNEFCLYGYFTTGMVPASSALTTATPGYGVTAVQLAG